MRSTQLVAVLSVCCLLSTVQGCTKIVSGSIFNFSQLASNTYNTYLGTTGTLYWNACQNTLPDPQSCNQDNIYAAFYKSQNTCTAITGTGIFNAADFEYVDNSDHSSGIQITYSSGQVVDNYPSSFTLKVLCDSSISTGFTTNGLLISSTQDYLLTVSSSAGCPTIDLSSLWEFLSNNKWICVAVMFTLGVFLCFFGLKFLKVTLLITGFILGFAISFMIWEAVMPSNSSNGLNWTALIVSLLVGVSGSVLAFRVEKAGIFALGALAGTFLGMIIFNTFHFGSTQKYILYLEISLCALISGSLAVYIQDYILILASSLTGAYLIVRSISLYAGGFPNEFNVSQEIQNGNYSFPWYYYLYLTAIIILKISGGIYQYRQRKASKQGKKKEKGSASSDDYHRI